jgi:head-tail adaptor
MIRAGKLDRAITIERASESVDAAGTVSQTWTTFALLRAESVSPKVEEIMRAGAEADTTTVFRTRYVDGITIADRINAAPGAYFDIKRIVEIGRRRALELHAVARQ